MMQVTRGTFLCMWDNHGLPGNTGSQRKEETEKWKKEPSRVSRKEVRASEGCLLQKTGGFWDSFPVAQ